MFRSISSSTTCVFQYRDCLSSNIINVFRECCALYPSSLAMYKHSPSYLADLVKSGWNTARPVVPPNGATCGVDVM